MSIVIFGDIFSFPEGDASTNRVYTYAKGFIENDKKVYVVCFENQYSSEVEGQIDGIKYYHPFGQMKRSRYFLIRRYQKLIKYYNTIRLLKQISRDEKITAINICTNLFITHLFSWILAKMTSSKLIIEGNEHPLRHFQNGFVKKKIGVLKFYIESYLCDGVFCISHYLMDFYKSKGVSAHKLFLVPSTVDPTRFYSATKISNSRP
ncbi:MAG: glycosyltransferase, partial [Bacteroidia bacterium]|nr:glycosyltransferase [Bacteroidia bacterium]